MLKQLKFLKDVVDASNENRGVKLAAVEQRIAGSISGRWDAGAGISTRTEMLLPWSYETFEREMRAPVLKDFEIS